MPLVTDASTREGTYAPLTRPQLDLSAVAVRYDKLVPARSTIPCRWCEANLSSLEAAAALERDRPERLASQLDGDADEVGEMARTHPLDAIERWLHQSRNPRTPPAHATYQGERSRRLPDALPTTPDPEVVAALALDRLSAITGVRGTTPVPPSPSTASASRGSSRSECPGWNRCSGRFRRSTASSRTQASHAPRTACATVCRRATTARTGRGDHSPGVDLGCEEVGAVALPGILQRNGRRTPASTCPLGSTPEAQRLSEDALAPKKASSRQAGSFVTTYTQNLCRDHGVLGSTDGSPLDG